MFRLDTGYAWSHGDLRLTGGVDGGRGHEPRFPQRRRLLRRRARFAVSVSSNTFLISHGHLDHAAGLPYVLGQRAMRGLKNTRVFLPKALEPRMRDILRIWSEVEEPRVSVHHDQAWTRATRSR